jgi:hypothetical protein
MGHLASHEEVYFLLLKDLLIQCKLRASDTPLTATFLHCKRQQLNKRTTGGLCEAENAAEYDC